MVPVTTQTVVAMQTSMQITMHVCVVSPEGGDVVSWKRLMNMMAENEEYYCQANTFSQYFIVCIILPPYYFKYISIVDVGK